MLGPQTTRFQLARGLARQFPVRTPPSVHANYPFIWKGHREIEVTLLVLVRKRPMYRSDRPSRMIRIIRAVFRGLTRFSDDWGPTPITGLESYDVVRFHHPLERSVDSPEHAIGNSVIVLFLVLVRLTDRIRSSTAVD